MHWVRRVRFEVADHAEVIEILENEQPGVFDFDLPTNQSRQDDPSTITSTRRRIWFRKKQTPLSPCRRASSLGLLSPC
jgi:hypothetical protein